MHKPKKSLGQNFLKSKAIAKKIVAAGKLQKGDTVLEIGPGKGMLTEYLLETGATVIAVEKDDLLIGLLSERFTKELKTGQFTLIHKDILEFDPIDYGLGTIDYSIIANIPYYITGALFKKFLESNCQPKTMIFLVQKEVAERIVARDSKESILSISVKAYGTPKIALKVQSRFFSPEPKVDSAVLTVENISKKLFTATSPDAKRLEIDEKWFFEVVKAGFAHKRKVAIKNLLNLASLDKGRLEGLDLLKEIFQKLNISEKARPENIPTEQWIALAGLLGK